MTTNDSDSKYDKQFVNLGLERWKKSRELWLTPINNNETQLKINKNNKNININNNNIINNNNHYSRGEVVAKNIDIEDVIERIFSQTSNGQLVEPIPLCQMIDILIDFWESDGLYD